MLSAYKERWVSRGRGCVVRPNARAWRARVPQGTVGSNPTLSALMISPGFWISCHYIYSWQECYLLIQNWVRLFLCFDMDPPIHFDTIINYSSKEAV